VAYFLGHPVYEQGSLRVHWLFLTSAFPQCSRLQTVMA